MKMLDLIRTLLRSPLESIRVAYTFLTLCSLEFAKRILLPHHPVYQSLRTRLHRAYLVAAHLHYPDLVHCLPIRDDPVRAHRVETADFCAYVIPGQENILPTLDEESNLRVVLFAHGGGYARGEARMYQRYMERWHKKAADRHIRLVFFSVEYPLTTAASHPAQLDAFLAAYVYLLEAGLPASSISFMGDSAGGGLCILAGTELLSRSLPQPAGSVLVSPWIDHSLYDYDGGNPLIETDYVVSLNKLVPALAHMFVNDISGKAPEVNPLYRKSEEIKGLNKQLILTGAAEMVLQENVRWAEKCKDAGVPCQIVREWGQMHIYAMGTRWIAKSVRDKTDNLILSWIHDTHMQNPSIVESPECNLNSDGIR